MRSRGVSAVFLLLFVLTGRGEAGSELAAPPILAPAALAAQVLPGAPTPGVQPASGLPAREAPPRTLRAFWPVYAAFAVAWLAIVGYLLSFGGRLTRNTETLAELLRKRAS